MSKPEELAAWKDLAIHHSQMRSTSLRALFAADNQRFDTFQLQAAGIFLDYSKNHINQQTIDKLVALAEQSEVSAKIAQLFSGAIVNQSEHRPALHTALRYRGDDPIVVDGHDVVPMYNGY